MRPNVRSSMVGGLALGVLVGGVVAVRTVTGPSGRGTVPRPSTQAEPLSQLAEESASPGGYAPVVAAREAAEREIWGTLAALAVDAGVALRPLLLDVDFDPATWSYCTRRGERNELLECTLTGRVVVLARFDGAFRARMLALDERVKAAGWGPLPDATKDNSLHGVMVQYWDGEDVPDRRVGGLATAYYWGAKPAGLHQQLRVDFYDERSDPPLVSVPQHPTPAPIPGLRRGTFALVFSVHQRYFHEPPSPSAAA